MDPPQLSPHIQSIGVRNFTQSQDSTTTVRGAIKKELANRVIYDSQRVFDVLLNSEDQPVNSCLSAFNENPDVQHAIRRLKALEIEADKYPGSDVVQRKHERDMYPHLDTIFKFITAFGRPSATMTQKPREFHISHGAIVDGNHTFGFPKAEPDFVIANSGADYSIWRDVSAFVEVKATKKQGPRPIGARDSTVQMITAQAADYARIFMSARPFMLFSVALLICGSEFCVGVVDRDGVTLSPVLNIWTKTRTFIQLILSLSCYLTEEELGFDPTVYQICHDTTVTLQVPRPYPAYVIGPVGNDAGQRSWCTVEHPTWSSISLTGRGSLVWRVRECVKVEHNKPMLRGPVMILKNAWHNSKRDSESDVYLSVKGNHPGVAKFLTGGDVRDLRPVLRRTAEANPPGPVVKGILENTISVRHLRGDVFDAFAQTPVLHRLILSTVGRPLWEYSSDVELLKGLRAALEGHRFLYEQGILHRDISAGNILLAEDRNAPPGSEGFITDLEYAWKETITDQSKVSEPGSTDSVLAQRGAAITGTLQFMAMSLLNCLHESKPVTHTVEHDIESFIWSMIYAILRKLITVKHASSKETLLMTKLFRDSFGRLDIYLIRQSRVYLVPFDFLTRSKSALLRGNMSRRLFDFMFRLKGFMGRIANAFTQPEDEITLFGAFGPESDPQANSFTHTVFNAALTEAIELMEQGPYNWKSGV
ncbi:hypothetical protein HETIRDRAFT_321835 [Heterobasidion irregulare TC 32-1]|uniref:Protein kinase domain-containing protein n=1 Tax=Heterobasidion irregulare (strain TC 32-1) TaxID=747525 RepID=W4K2Q8_HETIT|nr:uncharacterized protein HETIRDRAFT_321835 [Heterobasidion irregulare TC 32-1]ETW80102.1 hypothetical protein HETIRDRAFT_321835 [Heterobasidion irregulare TC 32-1]